jgi:hypothetical protein
MHRFPPIIPPSSPGNTKGELLDIIRDRLFVIAWHDGYKGYTTNSDLLKNRIDWFIETFLFYKSIEQLRLIEAIPELHVTPSLLQEAGLIHKQVTVEQQVLYWKCVKGHENTVSKIARSPREYTANRARTFATFLSGPPASAHVCDLPQSARDPLRPYLFHVGRLSSGVKNRHRHEIREQKSFDPSKGSRFWAEAVAYSGGAEEVEYWTLMSADLMYGQQWTDRMVSAMSKLSLLASAGVSYYLAVYSPILE